MMHSLELASAPGGLRIAVMQGGDGARRGLAAEELERLIAASLPDQPVVRLKDGQPIVRGRDDLHVSLAHANGATALAVAPFPLGIDIEGVEPHLDVSEIAPELFSARDLAFLQSHDAAAQAETFYRLWTLKEARLKRQGLTLAQAPLPDIVGPDGRIAAGMSTSMLMLGEKRYCVGVCWDAAAAPFDFFASANC